MVQESNTGSPTCPQGLSSMDIQRSAKKKVGEKKKKKKKKKSDSVEVELIKKKNKK